MRISGTIKYLVTNDAIQSKVVTAARGVSNYDSTSFSNLVKNVTTLSVVSSFSIGCVRSQIVLNCNDWVQVSPYWTRNCSEEIPGIAWPSLSSTSVTLDSDNKVASYSYGVYINTNELWLSIEWKATNHIDSKPSSSDFSVPPPCGSGALLGDKGFMQKFKSGF